VSKGRDSGVKPNLGENKKKKTTERAKIGDWFQKRRTANL